MENNLSNDETTNLYDNARQFLKQIEIDINDIEKLKRLWNAAWFIDIRCRVDGREYFFEGEPLRAAFNKKDIEQQEQIYNLQAETVRLEELQLFIYKLTCVNKILMFTDFSLEEKKSICEKFDSVSTSEECKEIYKSYKDSIKKN